MKNIIVVGGTGFIGRHLIPTLARQKEVRVRVLVHKNSPVDLLNRKNIVMYKGDLLRAETLTELFVEKAIVVNLAYLRRHSSHDNQTATTNLLDACIKARISRFIHCSTVSVFGRFSGDLITENTECNPINEYEVDKMQIERRILEAADNAFEVAILRPTAIFGPGGKNLVKLTNDLRSRGAIFNYLKACLCNVRRMNLVSVHNVVASINLLIDTAKKINKEVFIVSDDEFKSNNYLYVEKYIRNSLGINGYSVPVLPIPSFVLKGLLRLVGKSNSNPCCVYSCQKLLDLGFKRAVAFEDGLVEFAKWSNVNSGI